MSTSNANGYPFIGFHYKGCSSVDNYKIYRTSNGDRYTENIDSDTVDTTVEVTGMDGAYYFGTTLKPKIFNIDFAFQELNQTQFNDLKEWLSKKIVISSTSPASNGEQSSSGNGTTSATTKQGLFEFYLDEDPNNKYMVRPTGSTQLKYLPFDKDGDVIYRGEGTIQFTAYNPNPILASGG